MDTDVIKLIESKHEVTLLGNNLNEFCVKFYGPRGNLVDFQVLLQVLIDFYFRNTIRNWNLEGSRSPPRALSLQITKHWIHEQNLPPKHRRSFRHSVFRRHQPSVDSFIRPFKHLRVLPATAAHVSKSNRPAQR